MKLELIDTSKKPIYLFDRFIIGYCFLMVVVIAVIGRSWSQYWDELSFYTGMAILTYVITQYINEKKNNIYRILRLLYPVLFFTFFYRATGSLMFLLFDSFLDVQIISFEKMIFGINPTLFIDQNLLTPWLTEPISFCYFSYYFMIPVFFIILYIKKDYEIIKNSMSAICLTFFLSYLLFFLYPIEGPRWYFAGQYVNNIEGPLFRRLVEMVINTGAVRGGCMPSSHFGIALVITMYSFKYYRNKAWIITVLTFGLAIGTVWGRFHYVSDVIVGGLIGLIVTLRIWKYYDSQQKVKSIKLKKSEKIKNNVS